MSAHAMYADVVVTGIGLLCPWTDSPANALAGGPRPAVSDDAWFDVKAQLGPRGYKYLPPACQYLLVAARRALTDSGDCLDAVDEDRRGAAVGTNHAASALRDSMNRTVIDGHANDLSPATAPFFSINLSGSRLSIQHGLKGFNLTVTSPRVAGLEAVEIGSRSVALRRSSLLLAGATEAPVAAHEPGVDTAEAGAVVLVIEPYEAAVARGATVYGSCRVRTFFLPPRLLESWEGRERAGCIVREVLNALLSNTDEMPPIHAVLDDSAVSATVAEMLRRSADHVDAIGSFGESQRPVGGGCLEPMLHVAGLLTTADRECIVATAAAEGNVALARLSPRPPQGRARSGRRTLTSPAGLTDRATETITEGTC